MNLTNVVIQSVAPLRQGVTKDGNEWTKVDIIVKEDSREYGESVIIAFMNDRTRMLDGMKAGDRVNVSFSMGVRSYTTKTGDTFYQNEARGWQISKVG